jgi:hypothetical protein
VRIYGAWVGSNLLDRLYKASLLHFIKHLLPRLGLLHKIRIGTARRNKLFRVLDLLLLLMIHLHLVWV